MQETPQQYTERLLKNVGEQDPMSILEATPGRVDALLRLLEKKGLQHKPAPDKWTAGQILAHFAEGEVVLAYRFRRILSESGKPIEAYDPNQWVKNSGYLQSDPQLGLALFVANRRANLALLKTLSPEQWACFGIHSERGEESIRHLSRLTAGHDINHLRQLELIAGM